MDGYTLKDRVRKGYKKIYWIRRQNERKWFTLVWRCIKKIDKGSSQNLEALKVETLIRLEEEEVV